MARKTLEGTVITSAQKTAKVEIENFVKHPIYSKVMKRKNNILAHDENNISKVGDRVLIEECRPVSLNKSFVIKKVIS